MGFSHRLLSLRYISFSVFSGPCNPCQLPGTPYFHSHGRESHKHGSQIKEALGQHFDNYVRSKICSKVSTYARAACMCCAVALQNVSFLHTWRETVEEGLPCFCASYKLRRLRAQYACVLAFLGIQYIGEPLSPIHGWLVFDSYRCCQQGWSFAAISRVS